MIMTKIFQFCLFWTTAARTVSAFVVVRNNHNHNVLSIRSTVLSSTIEVTDTDMIDSKTVEELQANVPKVQVVDSMPEFLPTDLKNRYYLLRHGQSTANVDEIISSDRTTLAYSEKHGLTELGVQQGLDSAGNLLDILEQTSKKGDRLVFVSSPFARARQTAEACESALLQLPENLERFKKLDVKVLTANIQLHNKLVERSFGRLDNEAIYTYGYVWPLDNFNVTHTAFGVESVAAVCHRIRECVMDLEEQFGTKDATTHVVLVSHADVLQIAQLYGARAENVGSFSSYRFKNGEVREMKIDDTSHLPTPQPLEKPDRITKTA